MSEVKKYRKKPVVIEAIQFDGTNSSQVKDWVGTCFYIGNDSKLLIKTLEGEMTISKGDYVIKGVKGEFYPCKPDIFEESYELEVEEWRTNPKMS